MTERKLGQMIGEVFVIRHDVNLHTEILDTPGAFDCASEGKQRPTNLPSFSDFFWKDGEEFEGDYKMVHHSR